MVYAVGVDKDARAIDNGNILLIAKEDFVRSQIAIRATSLQLPDLLGSRLSLR